MERDYEEIFQKVLDYEQTLHEKNRKRIKIGLKCIWIVPLFFLALLFLTGSNKVIFLILWIVSLFALSIYLIVVEYMDHNLQEKIMELKGEEGTIEAVTPADFDRAAQIIRKTREMIGEGLNSPAETQAEVTEKKDEAEEIKETEDGRKASNMRNIWKIFTTDIRRISNNVVAVVIIMGLSILPALYAWFNIFSNWDPYEPAATSQLKVAVASDDAGAEIMGLSLNVGDSVLEALGANTTIGWVFPGTTEEALEGVKNSDYYAALIIPENFTQEMLGFLDGEVDHPTIYYYENEKKNGIAPKITGKAKNAVQEQVNATFVSTVAEAVMKAGNALSMANASGQASVTGSLDSVKAQLQDYVVMLQSFQSIMSSAEMIMATSRNMLPDMDNILENGRNTMIGMQTMINSSVDAVDVMGDMVSSSMDMVTEALQYLSVFSDGLLDQMGSNNIGSTTDTGLGMAIGLVQGMQANMDVLGSLVTGQDAQIQAINQSLKNIEADLKQLQNSKGQVDTDVNTLRAQIREQIQICNKQLNNLMNDYNNNVRPSFRNTGKSMQQAFLNAAAMMNGTNVNMDEISDILGEYEQTIREGNLSLQDSLIIAQELLDKVSKIADNIKRITGADSYEDILNAMASDPTSVAEFVSSPVKLQTVPVYPVEHYGSAASPFYTILAIWVGALFLVAIIHVGVKPIDPGDHYKEYERYFGRYLLFFLIGQAQTLLTILGNLYYIEIQCQHKFLYWLAAAVASAAFSCFMYSVTFAFGNVGEALAIVVMVIQVAGSGGTFPIEALPKVFQWIYPFLPFQFGMKAFKECIAGMYGVDYWINVGKMVLFLIIALLLGLALEPPFRKLNHRIEKSKEKTGLMI